MARADLPRARKILKLLDEPSGSDLGRLPERAAEGLALMAADRAGTDLTGARKLLDEAFDRLRKVTIELHVYRSNDPGLANRMAALLSLVERIDPDRLGERLWLAAAYRTPVFENGFSEQVQSPVVLAALVARYDRAMAAAIIAPALDRMPGLTLPIRIIGHLPPSLEPNLEIDRSRSTGYRAAEISHPWGTCASGVSRNAIRSNESSPLHRAGIPLA